MVQLSDDCFAFGNSLISPEAAIKQLYKLLSPLPCETVPLTQADGRILAQDIVAQIPSPPFDNSAVDGYAVHGQNHNKLRLIGRAAAGHPFEGQLNEGEAVRIFTGARLPKGTDRVYMQEDCTFEENCIRIPPGLKQSANTRMMGEDVAQGMPIATKGELLNPPKLGLLAAQGIRDIQVSRRPRTILFSSGDELHASGEKLNEGGLYDSNQSLLAAQLRRYGWHVDIGGILPDEPKAIAKALEKASRKSDLLLTSGGISVGEEDHIKATIEKIGAIVHWRLAIKPGRPIALGKIGETLFVGLPGNPVAAFIGVMLLLRPLACLMQGSSVPKLRSWPIIANFSYKKKRGRREYVRVRLHEEKGLCKGIKYPKDGAGMLSGLAWADGLVVLGEEITAINPGEQVDFIPFDTIL